MRKVPVDRRDRGLDLFVLEMVKRGFSSPYDLLVQCGLSVGASKGALDRLEDESMIRRRAAASGRGKLSFEITSAGKKSLKSALPKLLANVPKEFESGIRLVCLARLSNGRKAADRVLLDNWITPQWGSHRLGEVRAVDIETWLRKLMPSDGKNAAPGTKAKIRNIMSAVFSHAVRYQWIEQNPVATVRQGARRQSLPEVLTRDEMVKLLKELGQRDRLLVLVLASTGMRRGEVLALKWSDIDFANMLICVRRSIYHQKINELCKTESSLEPVPLDAFNAGRS
jgi:integrase